MSKLVANNAFRSQGRKTQAWEAWIKLTTLHALAILGMVQLYSWFHLLDRQLPSEIDSQALQSIVDGDVYADTDYPLRPAKEPWDISTSYPYPKALTKRVSEGTWLRIATHPHLSEIVFDMLGDLYCMSTKIKQSDTTPTTAYPILRGIPYDKEAEFSSDGKQIVFISDAGFGVDNVWTMPYTTCEKMKSRSPDEARQSAIQQTNSTFRFFSSPAFHPNEPKVLATKWFLTGRPNGAGEIWEFPLLGHHKEDQIGERGGRCLIQREIPAAWSFDRYVESQLGSEQARYTPSGDGIVFSRNVKDGDLGKFTYNKDIHAGINAVYLLNMTTGQRIELVSATESAPNKPASPGGANMPRLSHDGLTLAFVRRCHDNEVLALKDMRSGTVHYVWNGLDYDLSTIPAFMGAYPNYGWTSNDNAIIFWAQGKLWSLSLRLNDLGERVAVEKPRMLPFEAHIHIALGQTRYSETNITEAELARHRPTYSFRGLRSDNSGRYVVFEAAGDNFVAEVSTGNIRAVPKPDPSVSCYSPSFVSGSAYVLQSCWDHQDFTSFALADVTRGTFVAIIGLQRGRYTSPVTNGNMIAYVRTGKDYMFGDVEETFGEGIWLAEMELPTEASRKISLSSPRRLAGIESSAQTKLSFTSIDDRPVLLVQNPTSIAYYDLGSSEVRGIVAGKTSVEMASLLKDRQVTAFRDFQHIWFTAISTNPHVQIWSKPRDYQTPDDLVRLSEVGGHDVTLSDDGTTVLWLLGRTLFHASVEQIIRHCSKASLESRDSGTCARAFVSTQALNVTFETALGIQNGIAVSKSLAIINASLVSMSHSAPRMIANATVLIDGGQITAAGAGSTIDLDIARVDIMDAGGGAVLPGFVDVHGHWGGFLSPYPMQSWEMETFLGYGVTTIHNPASNNVGGHMERNLIEKGRMYGPRVFHTGDVLYGSTQPSVYTEINSRADARAALLRVRAEGGDKASFSVKNYQLAARSARQRLLLEAASLDMLVVPEGGWSFDWGLTYFIDGYTSQEHPLPVPTLYEDVLSLVAASGSSYTPLAVMNYGGIFGQHWIHQTLNIPEDAKLRRYVKHDILESLTEVKQAPRSSYHLFNTTKSTAKLAARGVRTNIGAHGEQPIGFLYHSEMLMMSLGGQEPYEVLKHATIGGATSLGLQHSIGSIEVGKLADLVVYPPGVQTVEQVWNSSSHMEYVIRGGTLFSVEHGLEEVWPRKGRRQVRPRLDPAIDL